jgi:hypothetical protein
MRLGHNTEIEIEKGIFLDYFFKNGFEKKNPRREGHKNLCNLPHGFDIYLVNLKTIRQITQIFEAFSEMLNFIEFE